LKIDVQAFVEGCGWIGEGVIVMWRVAVDVAMGRRQMDRTCVARAVLNYHHANRAND